MRKKIKAKDVKPGQTFYCLEGSDKAHIRCIDHLGDIVNIDDRYIVHVEKENPEWIDYTIKGADVWVEVETVALASLNVGNKFKFPENEESEFVVCEEFGCTYNNYVWVREGNTISEFCGESQVIPIKEE